MSLSKNDEEFAEKLKDYEEVKVHDFKAGDHLRYSKAKYKEDGRSCSYVVVQRVDTSLVKGKVLLWVNSYGQQKFPDWCLDVENPFKKIRLYKRKERVWTGICNSDNCNTSTRKPYHSCYDCFIDQKK